MAVYTMRTFEACRWLLLGDVAFEEVEVDGRCVEEGLTGAYENAVIMPYVSSYTLLPCTSPQ